MSILGGKEELNLSENCLPTCFQKVPETSGEGVCGGLGRTMRGSWNQAELSLHPDFMSEATIGKLSLMHLKP